MSGAREVVTLQLGPYAGCVGAHWWGLQESLFSFDPATAKSDETIHHNVLFRPGKTSQGQETYTPRLILMDLKGSLGSLKQEGTLYHDTKTNTPVAWKGNLTTHREDPSPVNPFLKSLGRPEDNRSSSCGFSPRSLPGDGEQRNEASQTHPLETTVHVWSDFLRTYLHPRSLLTIHQYNHEGDSSRLEAFGQGEKLLQDTSYTEELEDRLHFFVEECDYLQISHFHIWKLRNTARSNTETIRKNHLIKTTKPMRRLYQLRSPSPPAPRLRTQPDTPDLQDKDCLRRGMLLLRSSCPSPPPTPPTPTRNEEEKKKRTAISLSVRHRGEGLKNGLSHSL